LGRKHPKFKITRANTGLTKREYIATQLMTQLIAENDTLSSAAIKAVQATELLLIELNKKQ